MSFWNIINFFDKYILLICWCVVEIYQQVLPDDDVMRVDEGAEAGLFQAASTWDDGTGVEPVRVFSLLVLSSSAPSSSSSPSSSSTSLWSSSLSSSKWSSLSTFDFRESFSWGRTDQAEVSQTSRFRAFHIVFPLFPIQLMMIWCQSNETMSILQIWPHSPECFEVDMFCGIAQQIPEKLGTENKWMEDSLQLFSENIFLIVFS